MWPESRTHLPVTVVVQTWQPLDARSTDDGLIHFEWDFECPPVSAPLPDYDALRRFRRLGEGQDGPDKALRIAKFARLYGPLCLPTSNDFRERPNVEHVSDWRHWARTMDAIIRICVRDPPARRSDYDHLKAKFAEVRDLFPVNKLVEGSARDGLLNSWAAKRDAARCVRRWLDIANVRVNFAWPETKLGPEWNVNGIGLLGALALGTVEVLRQNVTDEARLRGDKFEVVCHHCGTAFIPTRNPPPDRRRFCQKCRDKRLPEKYRDRDLAPRSRKPLTEFVFGGEWGVASSIAK